MCVVSHYIISYTCVLGHYMFAPSAGLGKSGIATAEFLSEQLPPVPLGGNCLTFWYHMYGRGTGNLTVSVNDPMSGIRNPFVTITGDQGDVWKKSSVRYIYRASQAECVSLRHRAGYCVFAKFIYL